MRKHLSTSVIEKDATMFGLKRKTYFKVFKESNKHLAKRIYSKAKHVGGYQPIETKIKEPLYPPPTGSGIGKNPSPTCEKPGFSGRLPNKKREIPMPECKPPKANNLDLLKELLTNPRVEGITINIEKVGAVEETKINAKLKEIPLVLSVDRSKVDKEFIEKLEKLQNEKTDVKPTY
jgi:hypothetical protein